MELRATMVNIHLTRMDRFFEMVLIENGENLTCFKIPCPDVYNTVYHESMSGIRAKRDLSIGTNLKHVE